MANTIITKNSSTASAVPTSGDLVQGELAVNVTDKRLFTENSGGTVVELGTNPSSLTLSGGTANGVLYLNGSNVATSGSALTFDGTTLGVNNGVTGGTAMSLTGTYAGSGTVAFINFQRVGGAVAGTLGYDDANTAIRFGTTTNHSTIFLQNNAEAMRLTSTGLGIGLGGGSPTEKLEVVGNGIFTGDISTTSTGRVNVRGSGTGVNYDFQIDNSDTLVNFRGSRSNAVTKAYAWYLDNSITEGMRLTSTGLGIGTSSPGARLSVVNAISAGNIGTSFQQEIVNNNGAGVGDWSGTIYRWSPNNANTNQAYIGAIVTSNAGDTLSDLVFGVKNSTTGSTIVEAMRIKQGNVGIGTSSPTNKLEVVTTGGELAAFTRDLATDVTFAISADNDGTICSTSGVHNMRFFTNAAERMRLDSSGNLLLGRSVNVNSGAEASKIEFYNTNSTYDIASIRTYIGAGQVNRGEFAFFVNNGASQQRAATIDYLGNVGIGTSSPTKLLTIGTTTTVNPTVRMNGSTTGGSDTYTYSFGIDDTADFAGMRLNFTDRITKGLQIFTAAGYSYPISFAANSATAQMTLDTSGNLGIGTSSPSRRLTVVGNGVSDNVPIRIISGSTAIDCFLELKDSTTTADYKVRVGSEGDKLTLYAGGAERMRIDSSGNVGIGTSSPTARLDIRNTGGTYDKGMSIQTVAGGNIGSFWTTLDHLYIGVSGAQVFTDWTGATERARIDSSGLLHVGETVHTDGSMFYNTSTALNAYRGSATASSGIFGMYSDFGGTKTVRAYFTVDGGLSNYSANDVNLSDERLKKDISLAGNYLEKICAIPVKNFRYKYQSESEDITLGVIAQDVLAVAPELVSQEGFGLESKEDYLSVYQTDLQYALMKCIQEQQAIIESLKARLDAANL